MKKTELAWFAGLCDGEGCFTVDFGTNKGNTPRVSLYFCIGMSRGDWIEKTEKILTELGVPHHCKIKKRTKVYEICVGSNKSVKKICKAIYPYVTVKKELIKRFKEYRGLPRGNQYTPRTDDEIRELASLIDFVRVFNRKKNIPYKWDGKKFLEAYGMEET